MSPTITSRNNERIKDIARLNDASYRSEMGLFLIEGAHLLEMALAHGVVQTVVSLEKIPHLPETIEQLLVSPDVLKKISNQKTPQGIVGVCRQLTPSKDFGKRIVFLDDVADPGNVGTLIRTAVAFSFSDVILTEKCASIYNDKVIGASQGGIFSVNLAKGSAKTLKDLRNAGYAIIITSLKASVPLNELPKLDKFVLVLGNEARGVSFEVEKEATHKVIIPMSNIDSLNVAVAGGILMHHLSEK